MYFNVTQTYLDCKSLHFKCVLKLLIADFMFLCFNFVADTVVVFV